MEDQRFINELHLQEEVLYNKILEYPEIKQLRLIQELIILNGGTPKHTLEPHTNILNMVEKVFNASERILNKSIVAKSYHTLNTWKEKILFLLETVGTAKPSEIISFICDAEKRTTDVDKVKIGNIVYNYLSAMHHKDKILDKTTNQEGTYYSIKKPH